MLTLAELLRIKAELDSHCPPWPFEWPIVCLIAHPSHRPLLESADISLIVRHGDTLYIRDQLDNGRIKPIYFNDAAPLDSLLGFRKNDRAL
jgi:hypothetical protein